MEVIPGVYQLSGIWDQIDLGASVYLVAAGDTLTLVDAGYRGKAVQILKRIHRLGFSPSKIKTIIITHHHPDHIGSLAALKEITQAEVIAHPADAPYIDGRLPQPGPAMPAWYSKLWGKLRWLLYTPPAEIDILVNDGDELPVAGGIRIIHTPGHTPGSISIYFKQKRLIMVGDLLARRLGLKLPSLPFTADVSMEIASIKKLANQEFEIICFGHGFPARHKAQDKVIKFAQRL